jgi:hypothetical protein
MKKVIAAGRICTASLPCRYLLRRLIKRYPDLLAAGAYLVVALVWIQTMPDTARLDRDEGFNIMKAALVERGYQLYSQIWSDQPPLFTHLLVGWRKLFGPGDGAARSLVAILVSIGLASVGRIATWIARNPRAGLLAVVLLVAARSVPKLSMAVMIGLPAISVALLSVWLMIAAARWRFGWLLLPVCGALFACSMQIKLFTFILAPMAIYVCIRAFGEIHSVVEENPRLTPRRQSRIFVAIGLLVLGFVTTTFFISPWRDPAWQQQLIRTHMKTGLPTDDSQYDSLRSIVMRFLEDAPLMIAFFTTILLAGREHFRRSLPMVVWMATSIIVLSQANPLWGHHRVMFSIPAAIITATATLAILDRINLSPNPSQAQRRDGWITKIVLTIALGYGSASLIYSFVRLGREREDTMDAEVLAELKKRSSQSQWVLSDDPHIVHAAGMLTPPETAVLSLKRLQRELTEERLGEISNAYQPKLLLFARHEWDAKFPGMLDRITAGCQIVLRKNKDRVRMFERVEK